MRHSASFFHFWHLGLDKAWSTAAISFSRSFGVALCMIHHLALQNVMHFVESPLKKGVWDLLS